MANASEATIKRVEFYYNYQEKIYARTGWVNDGSYDSFPAQVALLYSKTLGGAAVAAGGVANIKPRTARLYSSVCNATVTKPRWCENRNDYNGTAQIEYIQPLSNDMMWFTQATTTLLTGISFRVTVSQLSTKTVTVN